MYLHTSLGYLCRSWGGGFGTDAIVSVPLNRVHLVKCMHIGSDSCENSGCIWGWRSQGFWCADVSMSGGLSLDVLYSSPPDPWLSWKSDLTTFPVSPAIVLKRSVASAAWALGCWRNWACSRSLKSTLHSLWYGRYGCFLFFAPVSNVLILALLYPVLEWHVTVPGELLAVGTQTCSYLRNFRQFVWSTVSSLQLPFHWDNTDRRRVCSVSPSSRDLICILMGFHLPATCNW